MEYVYLGKITNTHGIKGEIRIISDFANKDIVFKKGFNIYIGKEKIQETINTYRVHKNYDMITLIGYNDINDVLKYKGSFVYINKDDIKGIIVDEDYINMEVYTDKYVGKITDILKGKEDIFVIENADKKYLVPKVDYFIKNIDLDDKKIYINNIKGLIDED